MNIPFSKPPLSIENQIELLKSRGMNILPADEEKARYYLTMVGYYKLSGYWFIFQEKYLKTGKGKDDTFVIPVTFNDILNIYIFDAKLRNLFMEALERCETAIKSSICNYMSVKMNDPFWYCDAKYFEDIKKLIFNKSNKQHPKTLITTQTYSDWFSEIQKKIDDIKNCEFKDSYIKKYNSKILPSWMAIELMTFGDISKMYQMINNGHHKKQIAREVGVTSGFLENALKIMHLTRNKCAHYSRLYNVVNGIYPNDIENKTINSIFNYKFSTNPKTQQLIFPVFYQLAYFLNNISGNTQWTIRVKDLIDNYSKKCKYISYEKMGFPLNWEKLPLFEKMLKNI